MFALRGSAIALVAAAVLGACSSSVPLNDKAQVETATPMPAQGGTGSGGSTGGASQSQVTPVDLGANNGGGDAAQRTIYFDFDSYVVKDDYRPIVEGQARRLAADPRRKMTVEGHTDDRGGSEYNLALGQKRAEAVVKSLETLGATDAQLEAVSFGKERPAVEGENEDAWAKNRRVELKDK